MRMCVCRVGLAHDGSSVGAPCAPGRRDRMDKERTRVACGTLDTEIEKTKTGA